MAFLLYALVIAAGLASPVQAGATAALEKIIGRPFEVGLISATGTVVVTLFGVLALGRSGVPRNGARAAPWWSWLSGAFGAVFIVAQPVVGGKLGAGAYIGLVVTAATVSAIVIDHHGWLRFPQRPATVWRIAGSVLMIAGVTLVAAT